MGFVGQKLGRRMFIVIGGVLLAIGAGLQAGAHGVSYLIAGRVVGGVGMGLTTTMVPIWVSETANAKHRGALVAAQLAIVIFGKYTSTPRLRTVMVRLSRYMSRGLTENRCNVSLLVRFRNGKSPPNLGRSAMDVSRHVSLTMTGVLPNLCVRVLTKP